MDITDAGYAFEEGCVLRIDCEAGATGEKVCTIVYIEDEELRATDTSLWNSGRDGVLYRLLATNDSLERPVFQIVLEPGWQHSSDSAGLGFGKNSPVCDLVDGPDDVNIESMNCPLAGNSTGPLVLCQCQQV